MKPGPRNLITDVEGLRVGNADDGSVKSGVTVLAADRPITASVHVMGGAPGTRETDLLAPDKLEEFELQLQQLQKEHELLRTSGKEHAVTPSSQKV
ncbi:MAG: P1 family peptidase, partial [Candidatus Puniceispirillaceae bacterium]